MLIVSAFALWRYGAVCMHIVRYGIEYGIEAESNLPRDGSISAVDDDGVSR